MESLMEECTKESGFKTADLGNQILGTRFGKPDLGNQTLDNESWTTDLV